MSRTTFWNTITGSYFMWMCHIVFNQSCVQRLVSLPSLRDARKSMNFFFIGIAFVTTFCAGTGIIMFAYYYDCDPVKSKIVTKYDKMVPRFVQDVTGHITGMSGNFYPNKSRFLLTFI